MTTPSKGSIEAKSSQQLGVGIILPPVWDQPNKAGWIEFKGKYEHYLMTCDSDPKKWYQCVSSRLNRQMMRLTNSQLCGGEARPISAPQGCQLMKELKWKKAVSKLDEILSPKTHASAVELFKDIAMESSKDADSFSTACLNYIDRFEQASELAVKARELIDEKQVLKVFIGGLKPVGVRDRIRGMNLEECSDAYDELMKLADIMQIVAENADLYTGLTGVRSDLGKVKQSEKNETNEAKTKGKEKRNLGGKKTFSGECFKCGRAGHKEEDCYAKKHFKTGVMLWTGKDDGKKLSGKPEKKKVKADEEFKNSNMEPAERRPVTETYASVTAGKTSRPEIQTSRKKGDPSDVDLPTVRVEIAMGKRSQVSASAVADTGATDNFINAKFLAGMKRSQPRAIVKKNNGSSRFRMAKGYVRSRGTVTVKINNIRAGEKRIRVEEELTLHIIDDLPYDCILGRHFLLTAKLLAGPLFTTTKTDSSKDPIETAGEIDGDKIEQQSDQVEHYDGKDLCHIPAAYRYKFVKMMEAYEDLFGPIKNPAKFPPVKIDFEKGQKVPQQAMPRVAETQIPAVRKKLEEMLELGVLERSASPASSRYLMVNKPDGDIRLTVDLRELNKKCNHVKETTPTAREILTQVKGAKLFCTLDLAKFFYQIELDKDSRYLTAMSTPIGKVQFCRLPMGFASSPAIGTTVLQQLLQLHPKGSGRGSCSYVDDILIYGNTYEEILEDLGEVLERLRKAGLKLSKSKARIAVQEVEYVGHRITPIGTAPKESRVQGVKGLTMPTNKKQARSFCGVMNYSREYIKDLSRILRPIYDVIGTANFEWGERQQNAFKQAKAAFLNATPLTWWTEGRQTVLETDASQIGIGAILYQIDNNGKKYTLGFYSEAFNQTQARWSTIEQEGYAIFKAVKHWHHLLYGRRFRVRTDHNNLRYMEKSANRKVGRWWSELTNYQMELEHVPGKENEVADGLSRLPDPETTEKEENGDTNGPVFLLTEEHEEKKVKLSTETDMFEEAFRRHHNHLSGHMGVEETVRRIKSDIPDEKNLSEKVKAKIQTCAWCQKDRTKAPTVHPKLNVLSVSEPFTSVSIDTIGPLPEDDDGNRHIIAVIDDFTRYCELFAVADTTARSAAQALVAVTGRYGRISHIRSDGGSQYINETIERLKETLGIEHTKSWPYHPQANGKVERSIQEIGRHLRAMVVTLKIANRWASVLPMVARICNATPNRKIGMAPAELLYGNAVNLDRDMVQIDTMDEKGGKHYPQIARDLKRTQERLIAKARERQDKEDERYLKKSPETPTEFKVGTLVLARYANEKRPNKLASMWEGPLKIAERNGNNYKCTHLATGKESRYDVERLREYVKDETTRAVEVATYDNQEDVVKEITSHRLKTGKKESTKGAWEFEVVWDDGTKEWLNYQEVRNMEVFDRYINQKGIKMFEKKNLGKGSVAISNKA